MVHRNRSFESAQRVYAIGDVHGRFDLFRQLMQLVSRDHARRDIAQTQIVILGDIIDRGPDAARMVQGCMKLTAYSDRFTVLKGNHEEMMVEALGGDLEVYRAWLRFGGRETLLSWNVDPANTTDTATEADLHKASEVVGKDVLAWLDQLPLYHQHDGFLFVHAGIRPWIPIPRQDADDLLWITDDFLTSRVDHGVKVVHGHSIMEDGPDVHPNRIGIDTGAYRTNRLTAIGVENGETWFLNTSGCDDLAGVTWLPPSAVPGRAVERHDMVG